VFLGTVFALSPTGPLSVSEGRDAPTTATYCRSIMATYNDGDTNVKFHKLPRLGMEKDESIAYIHTPGTSPTILCCNGFHSEMTGRKSTELEKYCKLTGRAFLRFDYRGHGLSSGAMEDYVLGDWIADSLTMIDLLLTNEKLILVGSSMGAWIALHCAMKRAHRVVGIVGVAPAPDFIRYIECELTDEQRADFESSGCIRFESEYSEEPYILSRNLIRESYDWDLLQGANPYIPVSCPVRLLHGTCDTSIPWERTETLSQALPKSLVQTTWVKDGDHRLSNEHHISLIISTVENLLLSYNKNTLEL